MGAYYVGQLLLVPYDFAPEGWVFCDGSELPIGDFGDLFALIGTIYGGDGEHTFAVPDLRGRTPIGTGNARGGSQYYLGETGGMEIVVLDSTNLAPHTHAWNVAAAPATGAHPQGSVLADGQSIYRSQSSADTALASAACSKSGASQWHDNMGPFLVMNWMIATGGIHPGEEQGESSWKPY